MSSSERPWIGSWVTARRAMQDCDALLHAGIVYFKLLAAFQGPPRQSRSVSVLAMFLGMFDLI